LVLAPITIDLYVDADARMDMQKLDEALAVFGPQSGAVNGSRSGSVEESAVDPLESVLELRETYRKRIEFNIHVDAAWVVT